MWKGVINKPIAVPNDPAAREKKSATKYLVSKKFSLLLLSRLRVSLKYKQKYERLLWITTFCTAGNTSEYNNENRVFELQRKIWRHKCSSKLKTQLNKQSSAKRKPEKNQAWRGFLNAWSFLLIWCSAFPSYYYQAHRELVLWVHNTPKDIKKYQLQCT